MAEEEAQKYWDVHKVCSVFMEMYLKDACSLTVLPSQEHLASSSDTIQDLREKLTISEEVHSQRLLPSAVPYPSFLFLGSGHGCVI